MVTGASGPPAPEFDGVLISPAVVALTSTADPGDALLVVGHLGAEAEIEQDFGGEMGATPRRARRLVPMVPPLVNRTGAGSIALDALVTRVLDGPPLILRVRTHPDGVRLVEASFESAGPPQAFANAMGSRDQALEIGVIAAGAGSQIWNVVDVAPPHALGAGPVAGIRFGTLQAEMVAAPLGTDPWHVPADAFGSYRFVTPPGVLPPGLVLDLVTARQAPGSAVEILPPLRVVIP